MANMVMEQLLPSLEKDMLPGLKAKKTEKKRVWFAVSHLCLQLMQFLRNIWFHFPAVERKNEWKSVFQGYIWKSCALIHYSWSLQALFCTLGSHFSFLKKSWNSFKKTNKKPLFHEFATFRWWRQYISWSRRTCLRGYQHWRRNVGCLFGSKRCWFTLTWTRSSTQEGSSRKKSEVFSSIW